jgi:hypothetical protein
MTTANEVVADVIALDHWIGGTSVPPLKTVTIASTA